MLTLIVPRDYFTFEAFMFSFVELLTGYWFVETYTIVNTERPS